MTIGKASVLALGILSGVALGVWVSPRLSDHASPPTTVTAPAAPAASEREITAPVAPRRSAPAKAAPPAVATTEPAAPAISPQTPELLDRLQPLLNKGADMRMASQGFRDAELFATVAHASKNTAVPFVLLKHRILNEGKTLDMALAELKPSMNAQIEASRARAEARSDLASIAAAL